MTPILPKIKRVILTGFSPLFEKTIEINIEHDIFVIIGGNGLGKTTILQAIVYCLTGGADETIEVEKNHRWNKNFFNGRIQYPNNAWVEVEFYIDKHHIKLKRGFFNHQILSLEINNKIVDNPIRTEKKFENFLVDEAGYTSLNDFYFLIYKLCYLAENRTNLVWDLNSQARMLMLLAGNKIINEAQFKDARAQLKEYDSKKRHAKVAVNKVDALLEKYSDNPVLLQRITQTDTSSEYILLTINSLTEKKLPLQKKAKQLQNEISDLTEIVEDLQNEIEEIESNYILDKLDKLEASESKLAIHKLLHYKLCPICGKNSDHLYSVASTNIQNSCCPICGTENQKKEYELSQLDNVDKVLSEKLIKKNELEKELLACLRKIESLESELYPIRLEYEEIRLSEPAVIIEEDKPREPFDELLIKFKEAKDEYNRYEKLFNDLQEKLTEQYNDFNVAINVKIENLKKLYQKYASDFLGTQCDLVKTDGNDKFLDLHLYVPKFDNKVRKTPESCSEAQRFFLDIAFRMAMIDFAKQLSKSSGSFICETPENALDLSYIQNVATMFNKFCQAGHSLVMTSNLQPGALAGPLLENLTKPERKESILNLLEYGRLSVVQKNARIALDKQLTAILEG